jgi:hypothetical protein
MNDQKKEQGTGNPLQVRQEMQSMQAEWRQQDSRAATLAVELPCGFLDEQGKVHVDLVVREMTGHEEDLLASKGPVLVRLNQIILNCAVRLGEIEDRAELAKAVRALTASDRMVAFIAIRRVSLGDVYSVRVQCPNAECREDVRYNLDLANMTVQPMADRAKRSFEDSMSSGDVVRWHVMRAEDEEWVNAKGKRREDVLTLGLLSRVEQVGEAVLDRDGHMREAMELLKNMSIRDRNRMRELFREREGHVDTQVDFSCPSCQHEWREELNLGQPGFFFPSAP